MIGQGEPSQSGWSEAEREVMALTDRLYEGLRAGGGDDRLAEHGQGRGARAR